jgi:hypothetical protein
VLTRQAQRARPRGGATARADLTFGDCPRGGLNLARGVLVAVFLSIPLWSIVVALVIVGVSAQ